MENSTFQFGPDFQVNGAVKKAFDETGFIVIKNLLSSAELSRLRSSLEVDNGLTSSKFQTQRDDGSGMKNKSVLWKHTGADITGLIARSEKVAGTMEGLLGGEVEHYHSKVVMKEPKTGAFPWHQDYGYWYKYGFLFPYMGTVWIAIDKADKGNGCLQILKGSHHAGRVDTVSLGETISADPARAEHMKKVCELVHCELDAGDAMFFHCNILHYSAANMSDRRRWAFLTCYNRTDNAAIDNGAYSHKDACTKLEKVPNSAILDEEPADALEGKEIFRLNVQQKSFNTVNIRSVISP